MARSEENFRETYGRPRPSASRDFRKDVIGDAVRCYRVRALKG